MRAIIVGADAPDAELVELNGALGFLVRERGVVTSSVTFETDGRVIYAVHTQRTPPEKRSRL